MGIIAMLKRGKTMKRSTLLFFVAFLHFTGYSSAQQTVEGKGQSIKRKIEEVISGYLTELNGKYKLSATEVTFEPGGYVSEHHHVAPHIVFVLSGELTSVLNGKTTIYKAGEYFFEPGNMTHAAFNKTRSPLVVISFDILPAGWKGRTVLPPLQTDR
jgi:quercetin dioxygenase-like cupin family protein